jgi:hypothetical protein
LICTNVIKRKITKDIPEKRLFIVDSRGEAELQADQTGAQDKSVLRVGDVALPLGNFALTVEQIEGAGATYFADQSGRIIDTKIGYTVTYGDGQATGLLEDIQNYEQKNLILRRGVCNRG